MSSNSHKLALNLDTIGLTASMLCAIHCAFFPVFLLALTFYGLNFVAGPLLEYSLIIVSVIIGVFTFSHGYRNHHRSWKPLAIFLSGLCIIFASHSLFHDTAHGTGFSPEYVFSPIGAILIGTGHYLNRKFTRRVNAKSCCK
jgi:hypothetical protein